MKDSRGNQRVSPETIEMIFSRMIAAFGGERIKAPSDVTKETWFLLLKDIDETSVLAAAMDLLAEPREWPPTPGQVRDRAIDIARGELNPISPTEAWERVCAFARRDHVELSAKEKRSLNVAGGTWAIKNASSIESARHIFLSHYKALCQDEKRRAVTMPAIARVANLTAPALPEKRTTDVLPQSIVHRGTPEEIKSILDGYVRRKEMQQ
jgi:hypothetical protein